ncbi:sn-1-specific diacylglycerol lipase ABHD11 [Halyomorpha halys]|uniref:sn-1-specific diacylglycerol lipase ABHD11 n=1 Tax=Halyomorpha halys TaxID=286706 RepID=UPI0006D51EDB|nr:protein ABHD11-like [Halyomorpha halys]
MTFERFFSRTFTHILKGATHCFRDMKALSTIKELKGIEPVSMSFNIYDKRRKEENYIPLIIMHGLFGSKSNWNSLSKALNELLYRKIITVDARNHGESPHTDEFSYFHLAKDIQHLISSLSLPKVHLMGHSMGGRASMLFSLLYPDYLEKLIIVDISPISHSSKMQGMVQYFKAMRSVNLEGVKTLSEARKKANEQLSVWVPEVEVRQFLLTNLVQHKEGYQWRVNLDVLEKAFHEKIMDFPIIPNRFEKSVLFIGGSRSDFLKKEDHGDILQLFPKARFEYLDAGHWVHAEKPKEFLQMVASFLKE